MEEKRTSVTKTTTTDPDRRVSRETTTRETEKRETVQRDDRDRPRKIEEITEIEEDSN